jgi:pyruvate dehydrogenase E2 component (dihydrolipoamide acetyltransferase)
MIIKNLIIFNKFFYNNNLIKLFKKHIQTNSTLSPAVLHLISKYNLDSKLIKGTGKKGIILKGDVLNYLLNKESTKQSTQNIFPSTTIIPKKKDLKNWNEILNSKEKKEIANQYKLSKFMIPHFYASTVIQIDKLLKIQLLLNQDLKNKILIDLKDFVIKACALTLKDLPELNSSWNFENQEIKSHSTINISILNPKNELNLNNDINNYDKVIILNADKKGIYSIAEERKEKKLTIENDATSFAILSLNYVENFTSIIIPPYSAIITMGKQKYSIIPDEENGLKLYIYLLIIFFKENLLFLMKSY